MKTVEEHNEDVFRRLRDRNGSGVQCPHCGDELKYPTPDLVLSSHPPQKHVQCYTCNYKTTIYC